MDPNKGSVASYRVSVDRKYVLTVLAYFFYVTAAHIPLYDLLGDPRLSVHISDPRAYKHRVHSCISIMKKRSYGEGGQPTQETKKKKKKLY